MLVQSRQISHPSGPHLSVTPDIPSTSSGFYSNTSSQRESPTNTGSTPGTPGPIRFHLGRQHPQNSPGLIQARVGGIILICKCQRLVSVLVDNQLGYVILGDLILCIALFFHCTVQRLRRTLQHV